MYRHGLYENCMKSPEIQRFLFMFYRTLCSKNCCGTTCKPYIFLNHIIIAYPFMSGTPASFIQILSMSNYNDRLVTRNFRSSLFTNSTLLIFIVSQKWHDPVRIHTCMHCSLDQLIFINIFFFRSYL